MTRNGVFKANFIVLHKPSTKDKNLQAVYYGVCNASLGRIALFGFMGGIKTTAFVCMRWYLPEGLQGYKKEGVVCGVLRIMSCK